MFKFGKISIIIPCYGTEQFVERCINSVINQTYKDLEIIVVNDCSPGNMKEILANFENKDKRVKVVTHEKNKGLFQARLSGAKIATGDYIAFLDSDDYVDIDFYREMIYQIANDASDIVVCNTVVEDYDRKYIYNLFKTEKNVVEGSELLDEFFRQKGYNYRWHTVWNKIYTMNLWKKSVKHYGKIEGHLIMSEDFAFSTVLFYYAKKLTYNERANYFYCSNDNASTSLTKLSSKKCEKNISDINLSFSFVKNFLKSKKIYAKYAEEFEYWKALYLNIWNNNVKNAKFDHDEEKKLLDKINDIDCHLSDYNFDDSDVFYKVTTTFNDTLLKLKEMVINNEIISFDIFDTLVVRPFYKPSDLFILLNEDFNKIMNSSGILEFSKIRVDAEYSVRCKMYEENKFDEITIDDIYEYIADYYHLDINKLSIIKNKEMELEITFCNKRQTIHSIYDLCIYLGKKIIAVSDMYLPRKIIESILHKNDYNFFDRIYLSCEEKITKSTGKLFEYVIENGGYKPDQILHIGDNYSSDFEIPKKYEINTFLVPKTLDMFNKYCGMIFKKFELLNIDHSNTIEYLGNRVSYALIANRFFDNPFVTFNKETEFNCNSYFVGYYALGMHALAISNWILSDIKEKNFDSICFMARDGYIPYLATNKLKDLYSLKELKTKYIYVSRKSLMPLILKDYSDFYKIQDYLSLDKVTVKDVLDNLKYLLTLPENYEEILNNNNLKISEYLTDKEQFYKLIDVIYYNFYDKEKYNKYYNTAKEYFSDAFEGKTSTFDIGYSGKPELIISELIDKKIETYFIHCNNDTGYKNSKYGNFKINTFYPFKPTFTGTLREYLLSSSAPSCLGYIKNGNDINIEFNSNQEYTYFNKKMLEEIQSGCLEFIDDFKKTFEGYTDLIELNNYYMSIPFEYYLHYSKQVDRTIFSHLKFENNVSDYFMINDFWDNRLKEYELSYSKYKDLNNDTYNKFLDERVRCRNKLIKIFFYLTYDRVSLRNKVKNKLNNNGICYKFLQKIHRIFKRK